jgi:hypothetical protein
MPNPDQPKPDGALYTKWWFWALVGVSGVVIYELATASSSPAASPVRGAGGSPPPRTGLTLLSW